MRDSYENAVSKLQQGLSESWGREMLYRAALAKLRPRCTRCARPAVVRQNTEGAEVFLCSRCKVSEPCEAPLDEAVLGAGLLNAPPAVERDLYDRVANALQHCIRNNHPGHCNCAACGEAREALALHEKTFRAQRHDED